MEEKLKRAALRLQEVELLLSQPEVYADPARLRDLTREQKELEPVVIAFRELEAARIMPQTFFVCTCFMPIAAAGRLMWSTAATRS